MAAIMKRLLRSLKINDAPYDIDNVFSFLQLRDSLLKVRCEDRIFTSRILMRSLIGNTINAYKFLSDKLSLLSMRFVRSGHLFKVEVTGFNCYSKEIFPFVKHSYDVRQATSLRFVYTHNYIDVALPTNNTFGSYQMMGNNFSYEDFHDAFIIPYKTLKELNL